MTFIVSHGPLSDEHQISCETAAEALQIVERLRSEGSSFIVVTQVETGDVAVEVLQVLARHEMKAAADA
ncbi:hypothetical protein [Chenggangzhangella methanolivorans]|uniref:Uncharacterized protein n=1 Tax=Chenggangzhangella methanolivorans TaxID=1437009 RepID=A0A9E6RD44_9HYPH|nr:hypothetical protein [Chenggangzhangella methanolivorans]QZO01620.1 hypothetical protein K6K41_09565 [Chenggangzhangella methanolivorans]